MDLPLERGKYSGARELYDSQGVLEEHDWNLARGKQAAGMARARNEKRMHSWIFVSRIQK